MKAFLSSIALLLFGLNLPAQTWFPDNAVWHFDYFNGSFEGYVRMEVAGDTTLDGLTGRRLQRSRTVLNHNDQQVSTQQMNDLVVRYADGVVWVYVSATAAYDTLYYFDAVPGERWQLAELSAPILCDPESWMEVTDTGSVSISGIALRYLAVDVHYLGPVPIVLQDTIIERIGSTQQYFLSHDHCNGAVDGAEGGSPRCYADNDLSYVREPGIICDLSLAIQAYAVGQVVAYPNPGSDFLQFEVPEGLSPLHVQLHDATGRIVLESSLSTAEGLEVSRLASAVYIVHVALGNGPPVAIGRWVKQ